MPITEMTLSDLYQTRYFVIPDYQRHYAWGRDQCESLIEDIEILDTNNAKQKRFMGYITTIASPHVITTNTFNNLDERVVVDGQQRLTSLSLFFASIVKRLLALSQNILADKIKENYLLVNLNQGGQIPRLKLQEIKSYVSGNNNSNGPVRDLYWQLINNVPVTQKPIIPAMKRMIENFKLFDSYVSDKSLNDTQLLLNKLQSQVVFGVNEASNMADAGDIFEGLNNRGKPLSDIERIKSHAVYAATALVNPNTNFTIQNQSFDRVKLVEFFNDFIGETYADLDQAGIGSPAYEKDLIVAHYPSFSESFANLGFVPIQKIDKDQPSDFFRISLNLREAKAQKKEMDLIKCAYVYLEKLCDAAGFYADIRRPHHQKAFVSWSNKSSKQVEIIQDYSDSLLSLKKNKHYGSILLTYRLSNPHDVDGYCCLVKAIEVVAFWTTAVSRGDFGASAVENLAKDLASNKKSLNDIVKIFYKRAASAILEKAKYYKEDISLIVDQKPYDAQEVCKAIKKIAANDDMSDEVYGNIIFEYWNSKSATPIFPSRDRVIDSIKKEEYFLRVVRPRKGQSIQNGLQGTTAEDRLDWSTHVSNIIPATHATQVALLKNVRDSGQYLNLDWQALKKAGVNDRLLPIGKQSFGPSYLRELANDFEVFIANRWFPDMDQTLKCDQKSTLCT